MLRHRFFFPVNFTKFLGTFYFKLSPGSRFCLLTFFFFLNVRAIEKLIIQKIIYNSEKLIHEDNFFREPRGLQSFNHINWALVFFIRDANAYLCNIFCSPCIKSDFCIYVIRNSFTLLLSVGKCYLCYHYC